MHQPKREICPAKKKEKCLHVKVNVTCFNLAVALAAAAAQNSPAIIRRRLSSSSSTGRLSLKDQSNGRHRHFLLLLLPRLIFGPVPFLYLLAGGWVLVNLIEELMPLADRFLLLLKCTS